ncbi:hypothetical protein L6452_05269 [Arctium lappa]|uniref:Uncharacterized protein n=1 Tax=Arctium lappa TaxID=4217 RepID=A0ACB9EG36_ARCLA|nr:hypothetical protein L6452_05269 [Arctium lappa]
MGCSKRDKFGLQLMRESFINDRVGLKERKRRRIELLSSGITRAWNAAVFAFGTVVLALSVSVVGPW